MSRLGRELDYQHWDKDDLVRAMMQAEDDIKELKTTLAEVREERDRFYRESRQSAQVLGGILRVLRDNGLGASLFGLAEELPAHVPVHRMVRETSLGGVCACGNQWLPVAARCVTQAVGS